MKSVKELLERGSNPITLMETFIAHARISEPKFHTLLYYDEESVKKQVKEAKGPLQGLPVVISDVIQWRGTPSTFGSILLKNHLVEEDAPEVKRLKEAGLTLFGKGNVGEFGLGFETDSPLMTPSLNPINPFYTLGSSGGGVAAAVASGLVPWAIGTDVSGALRAAASCTGLFALLPSRGRIPLVRRHLLPYTEQMFYRKGPIAKNLYDLALLFNYLVEKGPDYTKCLSKKGGSLKIAASPDLGFLPLDKQVKEKFEQTIQRFKSLGHNVELVALPFSNDLIEHFKELFATDRALLIAQLLDDHGENQKSLTPTTLKWIQLGHSISGLRYSLALIFQGWLQETLNNLFNKYDLLLTPALPTPPWKRGQPPAAIEGQPLDPYAGLWAFLFPFNMLGHPALVFPSGFSDSGLPIGMQLVAPHFYEERLLQVVNFDVATQGK